MDIQGKNERALPRPAGRPVPGSDEGRRGRGRRQLYEAGGDIMAWADPFFPDPAIPESVKKAMHEAIDGGFPAHYGMPIGIYELREALAEHISERTGLSIDPAAMSS